MFSNIVTNVGDPKKPWEDVPIEVLIEEERKKKEQELEQQRPRIHLPIPDYPPPSRREEDDQEASEYKIVIKL